MFPQRPLRHKDDLDLELLQLQYQSLASRMLLECGNQEIHYFVNGHLHHKYIPHLKPTQCLALRHLGIGLQRMRDESLCRHLVLVYLIIFVFPVSGSTSASTI